MEAIIGTWMLIPLPEQILIIVILLVLVWVFCDVKMPKRKPKKLEWGKPFMSKGPYREICEVRYCESEHKFQYYEHFRWSAAKHINGSPMRVNVQHFLKGGHTFTFNPYDYFDNPHQPTLDEAILFDVEFDYQYTKIAEDVALIVEGKFK